jgi:hypothetical protein
MMNPQKMTRKLKRFARRLLCCAGFHSFEVTECNGKAFSYGPTAGMWFHPDNFNHKCRICGKEI